jgi:hypothetical protein
MQPGSDHKHIGLAVIFQDRRRVRVASEFGCVRPEPIFLDNRCLNLCKCAREEHGSVVGWDITLQAEKSRFLFPMRSFHYFDLPNPLCCTIPLELTQPLTEMSARKCFRGVKRSRRVRLATSMPSLSHIVYKKFGILNISQTYRFPRRVTGIALPFSFLPVRGADNLTAIFEPIVYTMWDP